MAGMKEFKAAVDGEYLYAWAEGNSAIGVTPHADALVLMEKGLLATYPKERVRGHNAQIVKGGAATGVGIQGSLNAAAATMGSAIRASLDTGLYVRVKDIDHPVWRIPIKDARLQQRWDEILLQFYEGELGGA